jgi:hypothetical protein
MEKERKRERECEEGDESFVFEILIPCFLIFLSFVISFHLYPACCVISLNLVPQLSFHCI